MEWGVMKPWNKCSLGFRGMAGGPKTWASPGYLNPCLGNKPIRITTALPQSCMPHRSSIYPVCLHTTNIHKEKAKNKNNWRLGTYLIGKASTGLGDVTHSACIKSKVQTPTPKGVKYNILCPSVAASLPKERCLEYAMNSMTGIGAGCSSTYCWLETQWEMQKLQTYLQPSDPLLK